MIAEAPESAREWRLLETVATELVASAKDAAVQRLARRLERPAREGELIAILSLVDEKIRREIHERTAPRSA